MSYTDGQAFHVVSDKSNQTEAGHGTAKLNVVVLAL